MEASATFLLIYNKTNYVRQLRLKKIRVEGLIVENSASVPENLGVNPPLQVTEVAID